MAIGQSDRERLVHEELVYTGLTRTPLMAIASDVPFQGRRQALMAELFATTADVYRVLGQLDEEVDQLPAADGGEKTAEASARRLARVVGADLSDAGPEAWKNLARAFAEAQLRLIHDATLTNLSRGVLSQEAPLIGAGIGRALVERLAATAALGALFLAVQGYEWTRLIHYGLTVTSGAYGATFYTLIGTHAAHVLGALVWLSVTLVLAARGRFLDGGTTVLRACATYWHFVVGLWPILYVAVYLA
jgi:heme/copper-type cytochrome/quinol oxidase subunit 3